MNFAELKKSTIAKKITAITLSISIICGSFNFAFAATQVDQETLYPKLTNQTTRYVYSASSNSSYTITRLTGIADILAQFAEQSTLNQKQIYTYLNTLGGYVDGVETTLTNINTNLNSIKGYVDGVETGITTINTNLTNIKSYVDGLEGYVDGIEGYIDGIETALTTNNTRLNEIKTAVQSITTYNYSQVLSDILTNTGYLSVIDTYTQSIQDSIGYGSSIDNVQTKLSSIINWTSETNSSVIDLAEKISRTISRGYSFVAGRGSNGTSNVPSANNGIVTNSSSANIYVPFYTSSNNNSMQHVFMNIENMTITDFIYLLTNNVTEFGSRLFTPYTIYRLRENDFTDGGANEWFYAYSISDMLWGLQRQSSEFFSRLGFVLADDDTIAAKNANKAQEQAVLTNFTGSGNASASVNDYSDVASGLESVKGGITTNVSVSNAFGIFNNSDGYSWFTSNTANNLNTSGQNNRKSANEVEYTYYNAQLEAIYNAMGVKYD